jgi:hypothetical protein
VDSQDPARGHHATEGNEEHIATRQLCSTADAAAYVLDPPATHAWIHHQVKALPNIGSRHAGPETFSSFADNETSQSRSVDIPSVVRSALKLSLVHIAKYRHVVLITENKALQGVAKGQNVRLDSPLLSFLPLSAEGALMRRCHVLASFTRSAC